MQIHDFHEGERILKILVSSWAAGGVVGRRLDKEITLMGRGCGQLTWTCERLKQIQMLGTPLGKKLTPHCRTGLSQCQTS